MLRKINFKRLGLVLVLILLGVGFYGCELVDEKQSTEQPVGETLSAVLELEEQNEVIVCDFESLSIEKQEELVEDEEEEVLEVKKYSSQVEYINSLNELEKQKREDRLKEVSSYYNIRGNKYDWQNPNIEFNIEDIVGNKFSIALYHTDKYPLLSKEDFGFYNIDKIEFMPQTDKAPSMEFMSEEEKPEFLLMWRTVIYIYLIDEGTDKVLESINYFRRLDFVLSANPCFINDGAFLTVDLPEARLNIRSLFDYVDYDEDGCIFLITLDGNKITDLEEIAGYIKSLNKKPRE